MSLLVPQPRPLRYAPLVLAALALSSGSAFAGTDGDGLADNVDNCIAERNGPSIPDAGGNIQLDTDGDGFGNACDGDLNQDGFVGGPDFTLFLSCLNVPAASSLCLAADMDGSGVVDAADHDLFLRVFNGPPGPSSAPLASIASSSPAHGEIGVAITRETVLRFSLPLGVGAVTSDVFFASFAGAPLAARIQVSPDRKVATLFYDDPLPASARIRVTFDGDAVLDSSGRPVDADGDGIAGGRAFVDFDTLATTSFPNTAVFGRVFASQLTPDAGGGLTVNEPLEGVLISVDGQESTLFAVTDANGDFRLEPAPGGRFFVHVDGRTATNGVPPGAYYPSVGKAWQSEAGVETDIGDVHLPLVSPGTLQEVSLVQETVISFPQAVLMDFPEFALVNLRVPPDSLYSDDGTRGGMVGIAPVPPDRLPGELPPGLNFPIVITVQTDGGSNFDTPVPVCFPNLPDPDTGITPQPGDESALWSFNHDTGRFEVVGPATVSDDGTLICSDPGVGILAPGWHGTGTGTRGGGGETKKKKGGADDDEEPATCAPPGTPKKDPCKCKRKGVVGDPVRPFSGEFYLDEEDMRIKGRGLDFIWSRNYRSRVGRNTAQGNGWDYSYQIHIEAAGADITLFDGGSRSDVYRKQAAPNLWTRKELFRSLERNPDGSYSLVFEDQGRWEFNPLDGSVDQGMINQSVDRFGNALSFAYDGAGRLQTITDTLDRDIVLRYDSNGFIESITDFAGRVVSYAYYDGVEPGGSFGDLKSVTTPVVVGTPNGNDFPSGKTTSYTYSTGFADPRLNHNLLTVTDGRRNDPSDPTFGDGPYVVNAYGSSSDPASLDFDRVTRQNWGDLGDVIDFRYVPVFPSNVNGLTVMKTITNDRVGNVTEYFWDAGNRLVRQREYTGRADPDQPTSEIANRPSGKLRAGDPDFFETIWEYNEDSLEARIIHPNGNVIEKVYESDLNPNAPPRDRANLRLVRSLPGGHTPAGDQAVIEESLVRREFRKRLLRAELRHAEDRCPRQSDQLRLRRAGQSRSPDRPHRVDRGGLRVQSLRATDRPRLARQRQWQSPPG